MKLRNKLLAIICLMIASFIVVHYLISQYVLMTSFNDIENQAIHQNVSRALNALSTELGNLSSVCKDWAYWDETYSFIQGHNKGYIKNNIADRAFVDLRLNMVLYINSSGQIVYGKGINRELVYNIHELPAGLSFDQMSSATSVAKTGIQGILELPEGPMLVSAMPILSSEGKGPSRGILIMGRYLNTEEIQRLIQTTILSLSFSHPDDTAAASDFRKVQPYVIKDKIIVKPLNEATIAGYAYLKDIYGKPGIIMRVEMPREIYRQGQKAINYFYFMILLFGTFIALIALFMVERKILSRLFRLIYGVSAIGTDGDHSRRLQVTGNDELTILTKEINGMLDNLEQSQYQLQESDKQYRQIIDEAVSADFISNPEGQILMCNPSFIKMFGFNSEEQALSSNIRDLVPDGFSGDFLRLIKYQKKIKDSEFELVRCNGESLVAEGNIMGRFDDDGELIQIQGYIFDITQRKQAENEIRYLSFHDKLTGLYNRAFFDEELKRLDTERQLPLSVIVADVNGLKLINDALGHMEGDRLLVRAAEILINTCRQEDIISRWGGDEFVILLPLIDKNGVLAICDRIEKACEKASVDCLRLSISLGGDTKCEKDQDIREVIKTAEERMYRNKFLSNRNGGNNALILSLQEELWGKGYESEEHAERIEAMLIKMGRASGLPDSDFDNLTLLAILHDIGKSSIPNYIINKPGSLAAEEWDIVKKHSEIGYRIAHSSPELVPIAEAILAHHERWDGSGYPLGVKGEQIPLISRIFAIVDSYDVMTHECPYQEVFSPEQAAEELKRCSGTQFDPSLVEMFIDKVLGSCNNNDQKG
ncbi:MAG: CHASE4 domain-containing protein [Syntrophomonas sp.]